MKELVIFDLDGTLIKGQSQKLFIKFLWKKGVVSSWFYIRLMLWFLLYRLHIINEPGKIATHAFSFLKQMPRKKLSSIVDSFFNQVLIHQFYQDALLIIKEHQKNGRQIFIVSNAFDTLVERAARHINADGYIATKLKEHNGILNGEIDGNINYGQEKAKGVTELSLKNGLSLEDSWGYADHPSDIAFLKLMQYPFVVNARKSLKSCPAGLNFRFLEFKR